MVRTPRGDGAPGGALIASAARSWQSARLAVGEARQLFIIITPGLSANMKTKRQSRLSIRSEEPVREQRTCHEQLAQSAMSTMGGTSERDGKGAHTTRGRTRQSVTMGGGAHDRA